MKKDKLIEYIAVIFLFIVLFFDFFVSNMFNDKIVLAILLGIYVMACKKFVKSRKVDNVNKKTVIFLMVVFAIVYVAILYIIGIFVGFYKNSLRFSFKGLYSRILPHIAIIVFSEMIRSIFVLKNNKKTTIFITIALVCVDILTYLKIYKLSLLEDVLALVGYVILSSISLNLLSNYIVKRYGMIPNILYKVITVIYMYIFSVLPDIYIFFQSTFRIIYPYIIYVVLERLFIKNNFKLALKNNKVSIIALLISIFIAFGIVLLISCKFKYGILVVGSTSMTGTINKGDAIVFEKYVDQPLEEGQIIVFYKDNKRTIHEIKDIQTLNGDTIFYTKGKNNQQQDEGYRKKKDIIGIVKFKIVYIGWPTIWVNELFHK